MTVARVRLLVAAALVLAASGCGGGYRTATVTATPAPAGTGGTGLVGTTYVALGDDATVAIGSSACGLPPSATCPTNTTTQAGTARIAGNVAVNGYAQLLAAQLTNLHPAQPFFFVPLGVAGALTGGEPKPAPPPNQNDIVTNANQLAQLPGAVSSARGRSNRIVISLFAGINDVLDAFETQQCPGGAVTGTGGSLASPCGANGTTLAGSGNDPRTGSFYAGYRSLVAAIKAAAPNAVVLVGIPDLSRVPAFTGLSAAQLQQLSTDSSLANVALQDAAKDNAVTFAFADLFALGAASPGTLYAPGAYAADHFHFSDAAYLVVDGAAFTAFTAQYTGF
ncbi:MAG: GDSL-type esterase/lipase family protein [Candidatus Velthaea sp.]